MTDPTDFYIIAKKCPWQGCDNVTELSVPRSGYDAWRNGALIQNALPDLTVDNREFLISGYCPEHMTLLFTPPEDDGDEDFYYEDEDGDMDDATIHEQLHSIERAGGEAVDRRMCQGIGCKYGDAPGMQDQR